MSLPSTSSPILSTFNALDWILVVILAWSFITALLRGLIRELLTLAGLLLGIPVAAALYPRLAPRLASWLPSPAIAQVAAFLLIAVGLMLLCSLLGRILASTIRRFGIGFLDRLGGALFGLLRGSLLCTTLLLTSAAFLPQPQLLIAQSRIAPYFLAAAREVSFVVPQDLQEQISTGIKRILQAVDSVPRR